MNRPAKQLGAVPQAGEPQQRATVAPRAAPERSAAVNRPTTPERPRAEIAAAASAAVQPATRLVTAARKRKPWLTGPAIFGVAVVVLLYVGFMFPTERYITPRRGIGYVLGIVGGSLMLLLFIYSARKRVRWLRFLGPTARWFRFHMSLGLLGPLCILYHANFSLGAANSNVALFSMLTVAGSGLVGRYIYARIHHGLYGSKLTLGELQKSAAGLRTSSGKLSFLPELADRLEQAEHRILAAGPQAPLLSLAKVVTVGFIVVHARWRLLGYVRRSLRAAAARSRTVAAERRRLRRTARSYIDSRLAATRRVAGFQAYERLFSLWHALHLPLIFVLIGAGIVHVVAVNIY